MNGNAEKLGISVILSERSKNAAAAMTLTEPSMLRRKTILRPIASAFLLAVLALLALGRQSFPQSRGDKQAKAPMPAGAQAKTMALAARLAKPVTLDKAIDPNTPLKDALEFFSDRYKITIL